jgi:RNA polymerase sigma-70 factor (ECF subfamily)
MNAIDYTSLMTQVAKGDQIAFRDLATQLGQKMFHLAYRLMGYQRSAAEDAVQEALIKLWRFAPNWQPTGSVQAYISRLVYTSCMDIHRRTKPTEELPEEVEQQDTILDTILDQEQRRKLLEAIHQLPDRQKEAILLHYMGEHSQRQVAQILGTTEKGIERLLARSRKRLRGLLTPMTSEKGSY